MSELEEFVLGYIRQAGGIVEPPAYGVYEALLPEDLARRTRASPFQRLTFVDRAPEGATPLGYAHPLVEGMVEAALETPACARFYMNQVRLEKRGLAELGRKAFSFPNARLVESPRASEGRALFHLLQVNFKVALVTDEKRERFVSAWMDVQGGYPVEGLTAEMHLPLESESRLPSLPVAALRWRPGHPPGDRLPPEALAALLEGAAQAAMEELGDAVERLQTRAARYLELDRARLEQYYGEMEADLARRMGRTQDEPRRAALRGKLEATQAERAAKLADVEAKYRLRLEFDPINLALIAIPKIQLPVQIENRHARAERLLIWDPWRHVLEPLACDVCRQPRTTLSLCAEGHLFCNDAACAAPACVDCKRLYCQGCASQLTTCEVCQRPVCRKSLIRCDDCGRGACRQHVSLCHAAGGLPLKIQVLAPQPEVGAEPLPIAPPPEPPKTKEKKSVAAKPPRHEAPPALRQSSLRLDVQISTREPLITAFVHKVGRRGVAYRSWELVKDGVLVRCDCEKGLGCPAGGSIFLPALPAQIEAQLGAEIEMLLDEYDISPKRIQYLVGSGPESFRRAPRLVLPARWKDEARLVAARAAFKATYGKK